jgi:hypothetical protein
MQINSMIFYRTTVIKYLEKDNQSKIAYFIAATGLCAEFSLKHSFGEKIENLKTLYNQILDYYKSDS